jgi:hypothetical protein
LRRILDSQRSDLPACGGRTGTRVRKDQELFGAEPFDHCVLRVRLDCALRENDLGGRVTRRRAACWCAPCGQGTTPDAAVAMGDREPLGEPDAASSLCTARCRRSSTDPRPMQCSGDAPSARQHRRQHGSSREHGPTD